MSQQDWDKLHRSLFCEDPEIAQRLYQKPRKRGFREIEIHHEKQRLKREMAEYYNF